MSSLFGDVYITPVQEQKSEQEVSQCKTGPSINATENPLTGGIKTMKDILH